MWNHHGKVFYNNQMNIISHRIPRSLHGKRILWQFLLGENVWKFCGDSMGFHV